MDVSNLLIFVLVALYFGQQSVRVVIFMVRVSWRIRSRTFPPADATEEGRNFIADKLLLLSELRPGGPLLGVTLCFLGLLIGLASSVALSVDYIYRWWVPDWSMVPPRLSRPDNASGSLLPVLAATAAFGHFCSKALLKRLDPLRNSLFQELPSLRFSSYVDLGRTLIVGILLLFVYNGPYLWWVESRHVSRAMQSLVDAPMSTEYLEKTQSLHHATFFK